MSQTVTLVVWKTPRSSRSTRTVRGILLKWHGSTRADDKHDMEATVQASDSRLRSRTRENHQSRVRRNAVIISLDVRRLAPGLQIGSELTHFACQRTLIDPRALTNRQRFPKHLLSAKPATTTTDYSRAKHMHTCQEDHLAVVLSCQVRFEPTSTTAHTRGGESAIQALLRRIST